MEKYSLNVDIKDDSSLKTFYESGNFFSEELDEFECCLRDVFGDIAGQLAHDYFYPTEENRYFREIISKIISNYVDFEINDYDWDEDKIIRNVFKSEDLK